MWSICCTIALISHSSKVMLKILQARLQQYMHCELPDVQAGFRKGRTARDKLATSMGSLKKKESSRKASTSALLTTPKTLCGSQQMWKILKEMGIPDLLTIVLRNLHAGQEATVRTGCETTDWLQIEKWVHQGWILSPCLFNLYAEYIMRNARLDEEQAGFKIARRNINNLRCADDTTLMAESEDETKSLLMKLKEKSKIVDLKLNIQKTKIMASSPITSWQIDGKQWKHWETLFSWAPKLL